MERIYSYWNSKWRSGVYSCEKTPPSCLAGRWKTHHSVISSPQSGYLL